MDGPYGEFDDRDGPASAALIYVEDDAVGLRRRRVGRGFSYLDADGARVTDRRIIARIRSLAIPPAWQEVWICPDAQGHVQATGRDARGRKQYRYHPAWEAQRQLAKFDRIADFAERLPALRARTQADLRRRSLCQTRVLAAAVDLLDRTLIRIGSDAYVRENGSFGLTTIRQEHVDTTTSQLRFAFTGKSGRQWNVRLTDRRLVRVVRSCQELPGQRLFKFIDDHGEVQSIGSADVNDHLREIAGEGVTSKQFRTWAATVMAAVLLAAEPPPTSKRQASRAANAALDHVAQRLGNTRAVCRKSYVHPRVLADHAAGVLAGDLEAAARKAEPAPDGLAADEARVLAWLRAGEGRR